MTDIPKEKKSKYKLCKSENGCYCGISFQNNKKIVCALCANACCSLAKQNFCVCLISFTCEIHNKSIVCIGSHS